MLGGLGELGQDASGKSMWYVRVYVRMSYMEEIAMGKRESVCI